MKLIQQIFTSLLARLITVSLSVMLVTTNVFADTTYPKQDFSVSYASDSQNDIQKVITIEKLVCRYIDGHKRCWHE